MKTSKILFSVAILSIAFTSCKKDDPVANPDGTNPTCIELTGNQTTALTLTNHVTDPNVPDYCVSNTFFIKADVIVEPGVYIQMKNGSKIHVQTNGSFKCVGTANSKITIRGEASLTSGQWASVHFATNDTDNQLIHTNILGGGNGTTYDAMVFIGFTGYANIDNCNIILSSSNGIKTESATSNLGGISNSYISACQLYPIEINSRLVHHIDPSCTGGGNVNEMINVQSSQLQNTVTWKKQNFAYRINGSLGIAADVTIEPGANFRMAAASEIVINGGGSFNCIGTAADKIKFFGESSIPGSWGSIINASSSSLLNRFEYCVFDYGGGNATFQGMITVWGNGTHVRIGNSSITNSARYGVFENSQATFVDDGNNTWGGNALGDTN